VSDELDPPSAALEGLFEAERPLPPAPPDLHDRLLARISASVALSAGAAVALTGGAAGAIAAGKQLGALSSAKAIALAAGGAFLVGSAVGAGAYAVATGPRSSTPPVVPATASATDPRSHDPASASVTAPEHADAPGAPAAPSSSVSSRPPPVRSAPPSDPPAVASADRALLAERALIERARVALTRGAPAAALEALDEHAVLHPSGRLREEREALAIQALVRAGRDAEARGRAVTFRAAYPQSVFLPSVDRVAPP
jgi:hypothetical protein